ncbi:PE family protein [Mycobacterium szulgai]|nr:PE family protein [Mycobacterium szulgai]
MSFVVTTPEWMQSAAQELTAIRSALIDAATSAAAPTVSVAPAGADEVSGALAAMFGNLGQEYQAVSAQAQAFHAEFVKVLDASAQVYLGTETANSVSAPSAASGATSLALSNLVGGGLPAPGLPSLPGLTGLTSLLGLPALPSLPGLPSLLGLPGLGALPGLTVTGSGGNTFAAIAGPYQTLFSNTVANLQNLGNAWLANPAPFLHQFINNQIGYGQIISESFGKAAQDLGTGMAGMPAALQDLGPITTIPGRIAQNALNVLRTLTDVSFNIAVDTNPLNLGPAILGLPMALAIDAIGSPATTMSALGSSVAAFMSAAQSADVVGAAVAVITAPAVVANGFLNGQVSFGVPLPSVSLLGVPLAVPVTAGIPLGGILTPLSVVTAYVGPVTSPAVIPQTAVPLGGTPTGGIIPGLLIYLPQQLAQAIGAPAPEALPVSVSIGL